MVVNVGGIFVEGVLKGGYVVSDNIDENSFLEFILIGIGIEFVLCEKFVEILW